MGPMNHVIGGLHINAAWQIPLNDLFPVVMQAVTTITVAACFCVHVSVNCSVAAIYRWQC